MEGISLYFMLEKFVENVWRKVWNIIEIWFKLRHFY